MELVAVLSEEQIQKTAETAAEIWRECYAGLLSAEQISYMLEKIQSAEAIAGQISGEGYRYALIEEGGAVCGYVGFCKKDHPASEGHGLFLSKLYLKSPFRGRGFARKTVAYLEQVCLAEGLDYLWLTVNRGNDRAMARYEAYGFERWREECADIGSGFCMDDWFYRKFITPKTVLRLTCEGTCLNKN